MGGVFGAGENVVIGIVDTGIDPTHPSFSTVGEKPYGPLQKFRGGCEVAKEFPAGSCNGKIVAARHFAAAASEDGVFNASLHYASPLDGDGHGRLLNSSHSLLGLSYQTSSFQCFNDMCILFLSCSIRMQHNPTREHV